MEVKKSPKLLLEPRRGQFFSIGLTISLALVITAFEWRSPEYAVTVDLIADNPWEEIEEVPRTIIPPPEPPKPKVVMPKKIEETKEEVEPPMEIVFQEPDDPEPAGPIVIEIEDEEPEEVFDFVEEMPTPLGGLAGFYKFLGKNIKYPKQARRMGIEGKVFVQFIIDEEGNITELRIAKGIGAGCDQEALRVLENAPAWSPGRQRGRPVKVRMMVPILFSLNN